MRANPGVFLLLLGGVCWLPWPGSTSAAAAASLPDESGAEFQEVEAGREFDRRVAPLIAARCLDCHNETERRGELNLSDRREAVDGGQSGAVILPGQPDNSLLWQYVESDQMPPKKPLATAEKEVLRSWIAAGAVWGTDRIDAFRFTTESRAGMDWWALQPLASSEPPLSPRTAWIRNPIDAFVIQELEQAGLHPAPEADLRVLIRRLTFDLLGLPPTPGQIDEFLSDPSDQAWENLVDRILDSPHYGERWARHWLDIVRFGESNGFEYDEPRDNFWPYRNWVIGALNQDMPYDEFVRLQLAGDVINPDSGDAVTAAGFLVTGPHNTTLPSNDKMRMAMAQEELEDLAGVVGQTFLGLTINCARCHDHKFDPISQADYYRFAAALAGVQHGQREIPVSWTPEQLMRIPSVDSRIAAIRDELQSIDGPVRAAIIADRPHEPQEGIMAPESLAAWEFSQNLLDLKGRLPATAVAGAILHDGSLVVDGLSGYVETAAIPRDLTEKSLEAWVRLDRFDQAGGAAISLQSLDGQTFDAIVFGEQDAGQWMAGSDQFRRTRSFQGPVERDAKDRFVQIAITYQADGTITGYRDGLPYGSAYRTAQLLKFPADTAQVIFGLRHQPAGGNRLLAGRILRARLYDRALTADEVLASAQSANHLVVTEQQLQQTMTAAQRRQREQLQQEQEKLQQEVTVLRNSAVQQIYTCISGPAGVTRILLRGDVGSPSDTVAPAGLPVLPGGNPDFGLAVDAPEGQRRLRLAEWITDSDNPLFSRVLVNRLWHLHFGSGLVQTPSDLGFNGGRPSHPELLDWLSQHFRASGFRLKSLHRMIVTSATYRQSSRMDHRAAAKDAGNRLLWRWTPRRLESEAIRDAMLLVSGQLNPRSGGQGYRDVQHVKFKGSNFYHLLDQDVGDNGRRTVYRFTPRGGRNPFLDTFDCPDPSVTVPVRATTTTPLQALALMNNAMTFRLADALADRVQREVGGTEDAQVEHVYLLAYGRAATADDVRSAREFVTQYGLPALCRVLFNSNEFLHVW